MRRNPKSIFYAGLVFAFLILLISCGQQGNGGKDKIVKRTIPAKPSPSGKAPGGGEAAKTDGQSGKASKPMAAVRPPYNPEGKIDPFSPLFRQEPEIQPVETSAKGKTKRPERPRTPLERLELGQLKLVAIVFTDELRKALVEEASGKGYVVELGTSIGRERGKVVEIKKDRLIIQQEGEDDFGDVVVRKKELKLQKPPGE